MLSTRAIANLLVITFVAAVGAGCGSGKPSAPTPTSPTRPAAQQLEIRGLSSAITKGASIRLQAVITTAGPERDCTPRTQWATDDSAVARVSSDGILTAVISGFATVTATCDGLTASQRARVEAIVGRPWVYGRDVTLYPQMPGLSLLSQPSASLEFLDGPLAGERHPQSDLPSMANLTVPVTVRASARFYETTEFVLAETTEAFSNGHDATWAIPMTYVGDPNTETYVESVSGSGPRHTFAPRSAGLIEVGTFWVEDDPSSATYLTAQLWCEGRLLAQNIKRGGGNSGIAITQPIAAPSACEVRLSGAVTRYRLTITYPH